MIGRLSIPAIATGLFLAGCGSHQESAATNASADAPAAARDTALAAKADFDPCGVLSAGEVTAVTSDKVNSVRREDDTCHYKSNPDDGPTILVTLGDGRKRMAAMRRSNDLLGGMGDAVAGRSPAGADAAAAMKPGGTTPPAIGDEAVWGAASILAVRKGDDYVEVTPPVMHDPANHPGYPLVPDAERREIARKLAEQALAKLPTR